jgi:hypothetical protein
MKKVMIIERFMIVYFFMEKTSTFLIYFDPAKNRAFLKEVLQKLYMSDNNRYTCALLIPPVVTIACIQKNISDK